MVKAFDIDGKELKVGDWFYETWTWSPYYGTAFKVERIEQREEIEVVDVYYQRRDDKMLVQSKSSSLRKVESLLDKIVKEIDNELNETSK